jgi:hypothetical protein
MRGHARLAPLRQKNKHTRKPQAATGRDDAFADFQSKYNVGQMVVVKNGIFLLCMLFSRAIARSRHNTHM